MASTREQILAAALVKLKAALPGQLVERSRTTPVEREDGVAVLLYPQTETAEPGPQFVQRELRVVVRIIARGEVPDQAADDSAVAAHQALLQDPTLGVAGVNVSEDVTDWTMSDADLPACEVATTYVVRYATALASL